MKNALFVGATLLSGATLTTPAFAGEAPAGSWQAAARCCQPGPLGTCQRWCEPATGAVRGEKPDNGTPASESERTTSGGKDKKPGDNGAGK